MLLINNDTLNRALDNMKQNALNNLVATELKDSQTREELYMLSKVIDSFRAELEVFINIGATAKLKLGGH